MSLLKSIATFSGWTLISRITGFLRDMVLANYLGAGIVSDAFFVAFKLPNLFRSLFAEGAFTSAFVPIFSHKLVGDGKESAIEFASRAISLLVVILALFVLLMELVMPYLVVALAPGFVADEGKIELASFLSRITFPFLLLISLVSFQSGILNSLGKFAAPAAAPVILNIVMILAVYIFMPVIATPVYRIALGVTVAGFLEVLWLRYFLQKEGVFLKPQWNVLPIMHSPEIKNLFKKIAPGVLGAGVYQINMMVDTIIVSLVGTGAISWLYYANRIQQLPLGVVGAAIGVALLPILSRQLKAEQIDEAKNTQDKAIEYGALLSIPAAVAIIILAEPIINILFQHGKFGSLQTLMTSQAVVAYAVGLPVYVMVKAMTPNFFARCDTKTPVKYSIVVLITNLVFSLILMKPFGHVGIASATTLAAFVSFYQYTRGLKKRGYWSFSSQLINKIKKIIIASVAMGLVLYFGNWGLDIVFGGWLNLAILYKLAIFSLLCVFGVVSFCIVAKMVGAMDIVEMFKLLMKKEKKHA